MTELNILCFTKRIHEKGVNIGNQTKTRLLALGMKAKWSGIKKDARKRLNQLESTSESNQQIESGIRKGTGVSRVESRT